MVLLQVAVVGQPGFGIEVQAHFDVLVLHLESLGETGQSPQRPLRQVSRPLVSGQFQQSLAQPGRQHRGQGPVFGGFDEQGVQAGRLRFFPYPVEQDGLADAAQTDQEDALGRPGASNPFQRDPGRLAQFVPPRQLGGEACRLPVRRDCGSGPRGNYMKIREFMPDR